MKEITEQMTCYNCNHYSVCRWVDRLRRACPPTNTTTVMDRNPWFIETMNMWALMCNEYIETTGGEDV